MDKFGFITHHEVEQGSQEWHALRLGRFTASKFKDLLMAKSTAGYQKAIAAVVFERHTGQPFEGYTNAHMERGTELEPQARLVYEMETGEEVMPGGFFCNEIAGASPDGLVGTDNLVEFKCPAFNTHLAYLKTPAFLLKDYEVQAVGQLIMTGRKFCEIVSYFPGTRLVRVTVTWANSNIAKVKQVILEAEAEVQESLKLL